MKLYHTFFMSTAIILGLATGAAQLTPFENRYNNQKDSYGRLLSGEYQKIADLESRAGTYSNIEFFKARSENAAGSHNPRPMTLKGLGNTDAHLHELLQMRRALDRAMVGYAMQNNPTIVAKMHAAFECRLKNVNINRKIDDICKKDFTRYAIQAEESANPPIESSVSEQLPVEPIVQNPFSVPMPVESKPVVTPPVSSAVPMAVESKPIVTPPVVPMAVESKPVLTPPVVPMAVESKPVVTPPVTPIPVETKPIVAPVPVQSKSVVTPPAPVSIGKTDYVPEKENFNNSFVPQTNKLLPPPVEPVIESVPSQKQEKNLVTEPGETFDPLEHIHPSLRNKIRQEQQAHPTPTPAPVQPAPVQPNAKPIPDYKPDTQNTVPPVPQEEFGIKPLSETQKPNLKESSLQSPAQPASTPIPDYKSHKIPQENAPLLPQEGFGIKPLSEVKKPTLDTSSLRYDGSPMDMIPSPRLETMTR